MRYRLIPETTRQQHLEISLLVILAGWLVSVYYPSLPLRYLIPCVAILALVIPSVFRPLASIWFGMSHVMMPIMSKFILGAIYLILVIPVGFFKRKSLLEKRSIKYKKSTESNFIHRYKVFVKEDLIDPF